MKIISFIIFLIVSINTQFLYAQKDKCILKKIIKESKLYPNKGTKDTILREVFEIIYQGKDVLKINAITFPTIHRAGNNYNIPTKIEWDFIRTENTTYVIENKRDTIHKFDYNGKRQLIGDKPAHGFTYFAYIYDDAGKMIKCQFQNYFTKENSDSDVQLNYETPNEITYIQNSYGIKLKGRVTFDDKNNPFYDNLELGIIFNSAVLKHLSPNNVLLDYWIDTIAMRVTKHTSKYEYNSKKYPTKKYQQNWGQTVLWSFEYENYK